ALGVPGEEMLQDTLKSAIVSFGALSSALLFFLQQRTLRDAPVRWHAVMWLPLALLLYGLASMAWAHRYLAGVETVRWFVFGLLVWLGLNTLTRQRLPWLAAGVHAGAAVAALWAVLQFWFDWRFFPQGARPASTFINRNFFAEFAVCALPFGLVLLARARQSPMIALLGASNGLVILAILMTGTRSALIALWLQLLVLLPLIAWLYRREFAFVSWGGTQRALAWGLLAGVVLIGGMVPTGSPAIAGEGRGLTALERAVARTQEIRPGDESLNIRMVMWRATLRMIADRPLAGVGAGAWEEELPLYQTAGSQLETDYYVHNEFLQLVAEFGIVGWVVLALLTAYLLGAAWRTVRPAGTAALPQDAQAEAPWRAIVLTSLLALMVVSNIGFPWRLASTGALFALCLGALAASDARLGFTGR
ncbi:MAG: O-antigen ligase family protein, partial [Pseudomonadota bacterium]